jgi:hypothetical protein
MNKNKTIDLDEVNDKRVETTKKRVAHSLLLLNDSMIYAVSDATRAIKLASKAMSLLSVASEEMTYACEYNKWDLDVVDTINDSISKIANAIAPVVYHSDEEPDMEYGFKCDIQEAHDTLSKAFGYLLVWDDEDVKLEDI